MAKRREDFYEAKRRAALADLARTEGQGDATSGFTSQQTGAIVGRILARSGRGLNTGKKPRIIGPGEIFMIAILLAFFAWVAFDLYLA